MSCSDAMQHWALSWIFKSQQQGVGLTMTATHVQPGLIALAQRRPCAEIEILGCKDVLLGCWQKHTLTVAKMLFNCFLNWACLHYCWHTQYCRNCFRKLLQTLHTQLWARNQPKARSADSCLACTVSNAKGHTWGATELDSSHVCRRAVQ